MSSSAQHPPLPMARPPRAAQQPRPELTRMRECLISGTAAGLARHLGAPLWLVRATFIALTLLSGAGILLYVWCWVFTPWEPGESVPSRRAPVAWALLVVAVILELVVLPQLGAGYILSIPLSDVSSHPDAPVILDLGILLGLVALLVAAA